MIISRNIRAFSTSISCFSRMESFRTSKKIAFIGAGQMGTAIAKGLKFANVVESHQIILCGKTEPVFIENDQFNFKTTLSAKEANENGDIVFFCVKPKDLKTAIQMVMPLDPRKLYVSVAAGINLSQLFQWLEEDSMNPKSLFIQLMPNIACLVQEGVGCFIPSKNIPHDLIAEFRLIMKCQMPVLEQVSTDEEFDAACGLAGSGPAYIFMIIEALVEGGLKQGLTYDLALKLANQTIRGAATYLQQSGEHPALAKLKVCSPGGTTIEGVHTLENGGLRGIIMNAVEAATKKSASNRQK